MRPRPEPSDSAQYLSHFGGISRLLMRQARAGVLDWRTEGTSVDYQNDPVCLYTCLCISWCWMGRPAPLMWRPASPPGLDRGHTRYAFKSIKAARWSVGAESDAHRPDGVMIITTLTATHVASHA